MYFHTAFFATIAFILALRVSAAPLPIEVQRSVNREMIPVNTTLIYFKRQAQINTLPAEVPTQSLDGEVTRYLKRQEQINTLPAEVPTQSLDGEVTRYLKRQEQINNMPAEVPTQSLDGVIQAY